jgi:hypothetical protein
MVEVGAIDWKSVGAIAGPVLALAALAWQASERLRRPALEAWFRTEPYARMQGGPGDPEGGVQIYGAVRVVNPRPSALIVESYEMQGRDGWLFWQRTSLARHAVVEQIPPHDESTFRARHDDIRGSVRVRMRVKLRGRRRQLTSRWDRAGREPGEIATLEHPSIYSSSVAPNHEPYPTSPRSDH